MVVEASLAHLLLMRVWSMGGWSGNLLRAEIQAETELGLIAREQMEKGELLPDELMIALVRDGTHTHPPSMTMIIMSELLGWLAGVGGWQVRKRLAQEDCQLNGWILDGFPRTVRQATLMQVAAQPPPTTHPATHTCTSRPSHPPLLPLMTHHAVASRACLPTYCPPNDRNRASSQTWCWSWTGRMSW